MTTHAGSTKDLSALTQYAARPRRLAAAWESALWEDFFDEDLDDDEPPLDADYDDFARGDK